MIKIRTLCLSLLLLAVSSLALLNHVDLKYSAFSTKTPWDDTVFAITSVTGSGTGFLLNYNEKKYIVTNAHVCGSMKLGEFIGVRKNDGGMVKTRNPDYKTRILYKDFNKDICILNGIGDKALDLAEDYSFNDSVTAVGYPAMLPLQESKGSIIGMDIIRIGQPEISEQECIGPVRELLRGFFGPICVVSYKVIISDMRIYGGSSGSPVLNSDDEVIGVVFAGRTDGSAAFFIPLDTLKTALQELSQ